VVIVASCARAQREFLIAPFAADEPRSRPTPNLRAPFHRRRAR
jgi:hypothetical protein